MSVPTETLVEEDVRGHGFLSLGRGGLTITASPFSRTKYKDSCPDPSCFARFGNGCYTHGNASAALEACCLQHFTTDVDAVGRIHGVSAIHALECRSSDPDPFPWTAGAAHDK